MGMQCTADLEYTVEEEKEPTNKSVGLEQATLVFAAEIAATCTSLAERIIK
jgi:hypothetical protein